jgi:hypothetical protein
VVKAKENYEASDFYIVICNVISLYRAGMFKQVKSELQKYGISIAAYLEIRWRGKWSISYRCILVMKAKFLEEVF